MVLGLARWTSRGRHFVALGLVVTLLAITHPANADTSYGAVTGGYHQASSYVVTYQLQLDGPLPIGSPRFIGHMDFAVVSEQFRERTCSPSGLGIGVTCGWTVLLYPAGGRPLQGQDLLGNRVSGSCGGGSSYTDHRTEYPLGLDTEPSFSRVHLHMECALALNDGPATPLLIDVWGDFTVGVLISSPLVTGAYAAHNG